MAPRIPKQNARFFDVEGVSARGRSVLEMLRGYAGAPSQASVMRPGETEAYGLGETAGVAEMLIPGASMAKGALGAMLAGVIKPRGGNWIPGDVESSISNLFERLGETDPQRLAALREQMGNPELGRAQERRSGAGSKARSRSTSSVTWPHLKTLFAVWPTKAFCTWAFRRQWACRPGGFKGLGDSRGFPRGD
jgi:hypothetical protein